MIYTLIDAFCVSTVGSTAIGLSVVKIGEMRRERRKLISDVRKHLQKTDLPAMSGKDLEFIQRNLKLSAVNLCDPEEYVNPYAKLYPVAEIVDAEVVEETRWDRTRGKHLPTKMSDLWVENQNRLRAERMRLAQIERDEEYATRAVEQDEFGKTLERINREIDLGLLSLDRVAIDKLAVPGGTVSSKIVIDIGKRTYISKFHCNKCDMISGARDRTVTSCRNCDYKAEYAKGAEF